MAILKTGAALVDPTSADAHSCALARVMREFHHLVAVFEAGLLRSLDSLDAHPARPVASWSRDNARREACRLALADISAKYTRTYVRNSLRAVEQEGKSLEDSLHGLSLASLPHHHHANTHRLGSLYHGYFRLHSAELFDLLGQPADLRFGTLRFHAHHQPSSNVDALPGITVELALNNTFFVADSAETLPYHTFRLPSAPSLQNRGLLSRKPEDQGAFPAFDSWLLFTFLGNGCIKLEVPIEMCADVYGGCLRGREDEEVLFWGFYVDDDLEA